MKKSKTAKSKPSGKAISHPADEPTQEEIVAAAYSLWQQAGCSDGSDVQHWLAAEAQLRQSRVEARTSAMPHAPVVRS
jgi:hypothetical protein